MKAVALLSGGLDSTLALKIIKDQGIDVYALTFMTPFCLCDKGSGCGHIAVEVCRKLNIPIKLVYLKDEYLEIIKNPKYGYGKNLNPCIDCRILMFKEAKQFMHKIDASFIITGEVLGQRPKSQTRWALKVIEKESGLEGLIVRPLSAKLFKSSLPEKEGWINRDKLLAIVGRSRKTQLELAKQLNIDIFACPAGGCLLTDPQFSKRMLDLLKSNMLDLDNVLLIKNGRYFAISADFKLVVARNQDECKKLLTLTKQGDIVLKPTNGKGPVALGRGKFTESDIERAKELVKRYCKNSNDIAATMIK